MLKNIWNWLVGAEHTVEDILSTFFSTIKKLENLVSAKEKVIEIQSAVIEEAHDIRDRALDEIEKAKKAAEAIKALFS